MNVNLGSMPMMCAALEMGNPSQAIKSHVDSDDLQKLEVIDNLGRTQQANHINESGLYALILGSTKVTMPHRGQQELCLAFEHITRLTAGKDRHPFTRFK